MLELLKKVGPAAVVAPLDDELQGLSRLTDIFGACLFQESLQVIEILWPIPIVPGQQLEGNQVTRGSDQKR